MTPGVIARRRELPAPEEVFQMLQGRPGLFWLDSSLRRKPDGRFSVIGCNPSSVFEARGTAWAYGGRDGKKEAGADRPLAALESWLDRGRTPVPAEPSIPFWGGAIGYFGYDLGRQFEPVPAQAEPDELRAADVRLAWHDAAFVWDHETGASWTTGISSWRPAEEAIDELEDLIAVSGKRQAASGTSEAAKVERVVPNALAYDQFKSDLTRGEYMSRVEAARAAIARGEVYQINLGQRFSGTLLESPGQTYLELRRRNPAPFSFYQEAGEIGILGSSPERFIELEPSGRLRTFPIKGTRPRGGSADADARMRRDLESSAKERAELLMIVDLLRNDLGRVCETGSVAVKRLYSLETYATVHHLVAEIEGRLRPGVRLEQLLRAVFPGGSISGAPKVSALGVIDRLERHRRGLFTGATGYLGADGRIDLGMAIRTILCRDGRAHFQVGSGIVWDSDPAAEYAETIAKGRALFEALGWPAPAEGGGLSAER